MEEGGQAPAATTPPDPPPQPQSPSSSLGPALSHLPYGAEQQKGAKEVSGILYLCVCVHVCQKGAKQTAYGGLGGAEGQ